MGNGKFHRSTPPEQTNNQGHGSTAFGLALIVKGSGLAEKVSDNRVYQFLRWVYRTATITVITSTRNNPESEDIQRVERMQARR